MANDREQDEEQNDSSRPVTAASRRGRRVGAGENGAASRAKAGARESSGKPSGKSSAKSSDGTASTAKKGAPTRKRDHAEKSPSILVKVGRFLREVVNELRKVIWPTRKQMVTYFSVVLVFLIVLVAFVFGLDIMFSKGMFLIFG